MRQIADLNKLMHNTHIMIVILLACACKDENSGRPFQVC